MKYEKPIIEIIALKTEDILYLSNTDVSSGENIDPGEIF